MEVGPFRMDPLRPGELTLLDSGGWEEYSGIVFGARPSPSYAPFALCLAPVRARPPS